MGQRKRRWISAQQIIEAYDNEEITMSNIQSCLATSKSRSDISSKSAATAAKWQEARDVIYARPDAIRYRDTPTTTD